MKTIPTKAPLPVIANHYARNEKAALTWCLLEGLNSGKPIRVTSRYFKSKKRDLLRRIAQDMTGG